MNRTAIIIIFTVVLVAGCASAGADRNGSAKSAVKPSVKAEASKPVFVKTQKQIDARKKGVARAQEDIRRGELRILICGERISGEKPQRDPETGLMEHNEEGDDIPYNEYFDEMDGYNEAMRGYVKTHGIGK